MEEQYKKLLEEQKEKRENLLKEIEIKKVISKKTKIPYSVYISNFGGTIGSIKFKDLFREDNLNKKELIELLDLFKPIKMYMNKSSCLGFSCREEKNNENTLINSHILRYEGFNNKLKIIWYTKIKKDVFEIEAFISDKSFINEFLEVTYDKIEFKGGFRITNTYLKQNGNFKGYESVTWGRGSEEYPNDFTLYHKDLNINFKEYLN